MFQRNLDDYEICTPDAGDGEREEEVAQRKWAKHEMIVACASLALSIKRLCAAAAGVRAGVEDDRMAADYLGSHNTFGPVLSLHSRNGTMRWSSRELHINGCEDGLDGLRSFRNLRWNLPIPISL